MLVVWMRSGVHNAEPCGLWEVCMLVGYIKPWLGGHWVSGSTRCSSEWGGSHTCYLLLLIWRTIKLFANEDVLYLITANWLPTRTPADCLVCG